MFRYWRANVPTRLADFFPYNIFARRTKRTHVLDNSIEKKRGTHQTAESTRKEKNMNPNVRFNIKQKGRRKKTTRMIFVINGNNSWLLITCSCLDYLKYTRFELVFIDIGVLCVLKNDKNVSNENVI